MVAVEVEVVRTKGFSFLGSDSGLEGPKGLGPFVGDETAWY